MRVAFDPRDPYPLIAEGEYLYEDAKAHAATVDHWLGAKIDDVETELDKQGAADDGQQRWIGLAPQVLQTPYLELRSILARLRPMAGETVVDLGAGYGRLGLVLGAHYPHVDFIGYELVPERVLEGQRILAEQGCTEAKLECADLAALDFRPLAAAYYFLYDFGARDAIKKCLGDLREISVERGITVVARGRAARDAIERGHPWLSAVIEASHTKNWSIYRSR